MAPICSNVPYLMNTLVGIVEEEEVFRTMLVKLVNARAG
ncbi:MAG: hypothetical protein JWR69_3647 [Pedosphaera sp.]|nr:hypothetical protein [Pedosphaera sp.]